MKYFLKWWAERLVYGRQPLHLELMPAALPRLLLACVPASLWMYHHNVSKVMGSALDWEEAVGARGLNPVARYVKPWSKISIPGDILTLGDNCENEPLWLGDSLWKDLLVFLILVVTGPKVGFYILSPCNSCHWESSGEKTKKERKQFSLLFRSPKIFIGSHMWAFSYIYFDAYLWQFILDICLKVNYRDS